MSASAPTAGEPYVYERVETFQLMHWSTLRIHVRVVCALDHKLKKQYNQFASETPNLLFVQSCLTELALV